MCPMPWMVLAVTAVTSLSGVCSLWLVLRFLWHVYDRGGAPDVVAAARAVRESRRWSGFGERSGRLPGRAGRP